MSEEVTNAELARMIAEGFSSVDARFESVDARFKSVDARFASMNTRFESIHTRFDSIDARFDEQQKYMDATFATRKDLEQSLDNQNQLLTKSMGDLEARLEKSIARVKRDVSVAIAGAKKRTTDEHKKVVKDYAALVKRITKLESDLQRLKSRVTTS